MGDIEQLKKNVDEIKNSLQALKDNVSISDEDKKNKVETIKVKAETIKENLKKEVNSLIDKADETSKENIEKAKAILSSLNEVIDLQINIKETSDKDNKKNNNDNKTNDKDNEAADKDNEVAGSSKKKTSFWEWSIWKRLKRGWIAIATRLWLYTVKKWLSWKKYYESEIKNEAENKVIETTNQVVEDENKLDNNKEIVKKESKENNKNDKDIQSTPSKNNTKETTQKKDKSEKTNSSNTLSNKKSNENNNIWDSKWKSKELKENKETAADNTNSEKLKSFFENNATNLSINKIDSKDFYEVSYVDKNSGSKVKGIIPFKRNWDSNIYMPGDRSGIEETMRQKNFKQEITNKNSKKARFIFEWDSNKIKNWTQQSARYNNLIKNFKNMISPMKMAGDHPRINIIWHSRAGATVNRLIGDSWSISNFIILDWTYWVYKNVIQSKIPGKIFYTNGGGTKKYINNYKNKSNLEVIWDYANLSHEQIVSKALFNNPSTHQELFA